MKINRLVFLLLCAMPLQAAHIRGVEGIALSVSDLDRSMDFYTHTLPFQKVSETDLSGADAERVFGIFGLHVREAHLKLGDEQVVLRQFLTPEGRPIPVDSRSNDQWFQHFAIIVSDMDKAYAQLKDHHIRYASTGPQRLPDWNKNAGGIKAFYFKDPDGHPIEILEFPPAKGDPKWHRKSGLFLGIDHTAIVVHSTEKSLRFYRDLLGLSIKGESENYGTEQEHLNNVFGARLHITSLRAASGPGIEFLEYIAPSDGRPYSTEYRSNDLVYTQTLLESTDVVADGQALQRADVPFVSPGVVPVSDKTLGMKAGCLVRDPDGHAVLLEEHSHATAH